MASLCGRVERWFDDSPRARMAFGVLLLVGGVVFLVVSVKRSLERELDIYVILNASRNMLAGVDIYSLPAPNGAYYLYTPLLAFLFIPFALLPQSIAGVGWTLICILLLALSLHECVRLISAEHYSTLRPFEKWLLHIAPLVLCADAVSSEVGNAQVNCLILAVAVLALMVNESKHQVASGAMLGLAAAAKIFTAPVLVYELLYRRAKLLAAAACAAMIGLSLPAAVVGWQGNLNYLTYWTLNIALYRDLATHPAGFAGNASVQAVLTRLFTEIPAFTMNAATYRLNITNIDPAVVQMIGIAVPLLGLLLLVVYYALFLGRPRLISCWGGSALSFAVIPLITPVLERPHFVMLLPAYVYVTWLWLHEKLRSRSFIALILAAWVLSTLTLKLYVGSFWANVFWSLGAPTLADICLIVAIFVAAATPRRPDLTTD